MFQAIYGATSGEYVLPRKHVGGKASISMILIKPFAARHLMLSEEGESQIEALSSYFSSLPDKTFV